MGFEYEQTISGILENRFRENSFYNFAVGSYSPTVHLFNLEKQINLGNFPKKIILLLDIKYVNDEAARWRINDDKPELLNSKHYDEFYKKKFFIKILKFQEDLFYNLSDKNFKISNYP